jgi:hypothetical protein
MGAAMSSKISVVTSCSAKGWSEYGKRFVQTFLQHWPAEVDLYLVTEDLPESAVTSRSWLRPFQVYHLWRSSEAANSFHLRHKDNLRAQGLESVPRQAAVRHKKRVKDGYDFRLDAYKFSKKVFAIELVAKLVGEGRLFWVDADVVTFAPVPIDALHRLLPADKSLSCLDRGEYHSECGFVGYNLDRPDTLKFIQGFASLYAEDEVFGLDEWHDSWVFDWLRHTLQVPTYSIPHLSRRNPVANSELSKFCDHHKGRRKEIGRSPKSERLIKDGTAYWS